MIELCGVSSWGVSRIRRACGMTTALQPDSDVSVIAPVVGAIAPWPATPTAGAARCVPGRGELQLVGGKPEGPGASPDADARLVCEVRGRLSDATTVRRLRTTGPVQLELLSGREGPGPELVWASLPERAREAVLVLLARLIDVGAIAEEG
jgi:hypothetical protein